MSARHFMFFLCLFLSLLFPCFLPRPSYAAVVGFQPVNPDELKMTSEPLVPGAPAIILDREVYRDDAGQFNQSDRVEENYVRIKILTEEGRKYATAEIQMLAGFIGVVGLHARTIHADGSIVDFNGQVFEKTIEKQKGLKYHAKTITLPDVQVGSVIEYYYTIDFENYYIWDSHWILSQELFQKHAGFSLRPFAKEGYHLNMRWSLHLPPGVPEPQQGKDGMVRLEAKSLPAFTVEDFMPPATELQARVDFIYSYEYFEPDVIKYWKNVGKKRNHEIDSFLSDRSALQEELSHIVSPSDPPEIKLQKAYARVQQIRNTSYEPAKTDEEKKRAHETGQLKVGDVLKRGYGSEEQLNWFFLGLAREAGLEAYGLDVSNRGEYFFSPQSLDHGLLNQTSVLVKFNGKDLYFEPGAAYAPFGFLKWEATGVQGLRLDRDGGTWITTTVPDSSASQIQRKAELKLTDNGDLEGTVTITYTGLEGFSRRLEERNEDDVARKKYIENELKRYIPVASEVTLSNTPQWTNSAIPLVAEFKVKIPGWVSRGGRLALCPVGIFGATERHIFDGTVRVHPIYFEFESERVDDVVINLPSGWQVSSLPQPQNQDYRVVAYSVGAESDKTSLRLKRKLDINIFFLETKYYGPIRSFFQQVRAGDTEQVLLQPGATVSSN
jgi:hypothetical protein